MAVVHRTALVPSKLELLTSWLPSRPWYRGGAGGAELAKAGGFRLNDPQGEVGIEFIAVTDVGGPHPATYLVPLSYRGAPLDGMEHALVGTMEHGVLGRRWAYDGCHDPVLVAELLALVEGRAQAQDQNTSDTPDREVTRSCTGAGSISTVPFTDTTDATVTDDAEGTALAFPHGGVLRLHRILRPAPDGPASLPQGAIGQVSGPWRAQGGAPARGLFAVLYPGAPPAPSAV
ncbi:maltokinase N-terminal cap-like domain-containing protein [Streptomyces sp. NBC_00334]|uniref:maltokinase N-terminal cap-like domain-containing protein n=1 Tax=Streptomyces sp. NBC_00334 TaxID=2975713 RepID=UPI002E297C2E|nr:1,4-alpha-glucan branching protein [Streptomyces sp. NBC_00334]